MTRLGALIVSALLVGAVLSPLVRDPHDDGFPLSTYPMFATPRATRMSLSFAFGVTAGGERRTLDPGAIGTGEVLQALTTIGKAVGAGRAAALGMCHQIAAEVARADRFADVAEIVIVTGDEDAVAYLEDGTLGPEKERARCAVTP